MSGRISELQSETVTGNAGIVKRISIKNFMCHEHLNVNFNSHINFICGKNGSGKSAIMTALVIALGGKSSDTNRGSNVKALIKSGKSQAIIDVTLSNTGSRAYQPEVFGDEITITRVINPSSNLYKICKWNGKPVSNLKRELNNILNVFKIQINNPISVLNQEMAKSFIKTSNPRDLYRFFMRSTLLQDVEDLINNEKQVVMPALIRVLASKGNELKSATKSLEDIRKKHEKKKQLIELQNESKQLQKELDWTLVYNARNEKAKLIKRKEQIEIEIGNINGKLQDSGAVKKELDAKKAELTEQLNELNRLRDENVSQMLSFERNYKKVVDNLEELKIDYRKMKKKLHGSRVNYEATEKKLQALDDQNLEAAARKNEIEEKKEGLKTKIEELKALVTTNNNHKRNLKASLQKKNEEVQAAETGLHQTLANINKSKQSLEKLKSHSSELTCYGDFMPRLVKEIENKKNRFERQPVGPLGHYIKLNDNAKCSGGSFGPAIESILGRGLLCGFAIHSHRDFNVFKEICNSLRIQKNPDCFISKFIDKVHDVSRFRVNHPNFPSVYDALDISHPVVANTIIDQCSVENVLLLPRDEDAFGLMDNVRSVPDQCNYVITLNSQFYPAPNYRSYFLTKETNTKFLQANKEALIKNLEYQLEICSKDERQQRTVVKSVKEEEKKIRSSLNQLEEEIERVDRDINRCHRELLNLDSDEDQISHEQETLREDLAYRKQNIDKLTADVEKLLLEVKTAEKECDEVKKAKESTAGVHNYKDEIKAVQEKLQEVDEQYHKDTVNFSKIRGKLKDQLTLKEKVSNSISKVEQEITELEAKVEGSRVIDEQSCRDKGELKDRLAQMRAEMEAINEFIGDGSIEEITEDLQNQFELTETIHALMQQLRDELNKLESKTQNLQCKLERSLREGSHMIRGNFKEIIKIRKYEEDLIFDHSGKKLNIVVKTGEKKNQVTSVLTLSGGERSYSMVAFILALWQEMQLPFYFLDEFDVFMDPLNRKLIIKLLMMHAKTNLNQQYVFFTPNDFHVDESANVGIFRMEDPRDD